MPAGMGKAFLTCHTFSGGWSGSVAGSLTSWYWVNSMRREAWPSRQKCETGTNSLLKVGLAVSLAALGAGESKSNEVSAARLDEGGVDEDAMWGRGRASGRDLPFLASLCPWPK